MKSGTLTRRFTTLLLAGICTLAPLRMALAGGPLGIDHRIA